MAAELRLEAGQPGVLEPAPAACAYQTIHKGYAVTWFGLATALVWVFLGFSSSAKVQRAKTTIWRPLRDEKITNNTATKNGGRLISDYFSHGCVLLGDRTSISFQPKRFNWDDKQWRLRAAAVDRAAA